MWHNTNNGKNSLIFELETYGKTPMLQIIMDKIMQWSEKKINNILLNVIWFCFYTSETNEAMTTLAGLWFFIVMYGLWELCAMENIEKSKNHHHKIQLEMNHLMDHKMAFFWKMDTVKRIQKKKQYRDQRSLHKNGYDKEYMWVCLDIIFMTFWLKSHGKRIHEKSDKGSIG